MQLNSVGPVGCLSDVIRFESLIYFVCSDSLVVCVVTVVEDGDEDDLDRNRELF